MLLKFIFPCLQNRKTFSNNKHKKLHSRDGKVFNNFNILVAVNEPWINLTKSFSAAAAGEFSSDCTSSVGALTMKD